MPYARETDVAVIYAHLSEEPPKPSRVRPELPRGLDAVIAKALDKSPDRRFETCGDLMTAARGAARRGRPAVRDAPPRADRQRSAAAERPAIEGMRDAAAAARRPRVLLGGSTRTRARSRGSRWATAWTCTRRRTAPSTPRATRGRTS